jgi:hypothetical protein
VSPAVAGMDVAEEGKNKNVLIARRGPLVTGVTDWSQMNTTQSAFRARDEAQHLKATHLFYDVSGVGAGIRGPLNSSEDLRFQPVPVNGGDSPSHTLWDSGKASAELFRNLRAELYWRLRSRFEKAYECRILGISHPFEEMISIPHHSQLIADLSLPLYSYNETGKIVIESKIAMRKRGVASPDFADALAYCFSPPPPVWDFD